MKKPKMPKFKPKKPLMNKTFFAFVFGFLGIVGVSFVVIIFATQFLSG